MLQLSAPREKLQGMITKVINPVCKNVAEEIWKNQLHAHLKYKIKKLHIGAWIEDGSLGFRHFSKWKKLAIVTEKDGIKKFTNTFGIFIPCPTKGFKMEELPLAKKWISDL